MASASRAGSAPTSTGHQSRSGKWRKNVSWRRAKRRVLFLISAFVYGREPIFPAKKAKSSR